MNISKYIGKTFPAGKTAKELGLDTSRKFVVVNKNNKSGFSIGDVLKFDRQDGYEEYHPKVYLFRHENSDLRQLIGLEHLAYLEEEDEVCLAEGVSNIEVYDTPKDMLNAFGQKVLSDPTVTEVTIAVGKQIDKPYVPRVGDRIRLEGVVRAIDEDGDATIRMAPNSNSGVNILVFSSDFQQLTLISRPPRTFTKAEAEKMLSEHLNESITIL